MTSTDDAVETLRAAITQKPPFCTGTVPLSSDDATLYYKSTDESAGWINLADAEKGLQALAEACQPATFGMDQRDVLDESYRKAGKLDTSHFATKLDLDKLHLMDRIRKQLLDGPDEFKSITAELYKLNVYGKDSFFKSHKDTPRGDSMFGSLVLVFPTQHEGGSLVLRHGGKEWSVDSGVVLQEPKVPSVLYIAFFSDVDHEVTTVKSGYRVTLTYNLFFKGPTAGQPTLALSPVAPEDGVFEAALSSALKDAAFLPEGGLLGFGLSFQYPITPQFRATPLQDTLQRLKGSDAVIKRVCNKLALNVSLKAIYLDDATNCGVEHKIMVDEVYSMSGWQVDEGMTTLLRGRPFNGKVIYDRGTNPPPEWDGSEIKGAVPVLWVTPLTAYSHFSSPYIAYGNEASAECVYADICIIVEIGAAGKRETKVQ
ncbi:hypothetical protein Hypma_004841 [Hypsizygus marmoreus]|uniref:Prolyl 4-hydroxylase alpha subunit Fe(2+) 2OG dioxygenase domain-containing protein n=1 Tax=Hypsizygus marmoreus TaxID=39966 RepID=A0A369J6C1_HYPMA|nr:hypothetical protein Hypma_004841 [Hypsizygus marmoreus]